MNKFGSLISEKKITADSYLKLQANVKPLALEKYV